MLKVICQSIPLAKILEVFTVPRKSDIYNEKVNKKNKHFYTNKNDWNVLLAQFSHNRR